MTKAVWVFLNLVAFHCFPVSATNVTVQEKADVAIPVTAPSPPEGNTTFLGDTSWCVARPGAAPVELQRALNWACGLGKADCGPIQADGPCFEPNTLHSHASYAFNSYYQQSGNSDVACYFGGTAALTQRDPSYARCSFATSEPKKSWATTLYEDKATWIWCRKAVVILLLLYF